MAKDEQQLKDSQTIEQYHTIAATVLDTLGDLYRLVMAKRILVCDSSFVYGQICCSLLMPDVEYRLHFALLD